MTKTTTALYVAAKGRGGYNRLEARRKGLDDATTTFASFMLLQ